MSANTSKSSDRLLRRAEAAKYVAENIQRTLLTKDAGKARLRKL